MPDLDDELASLRDDLRASVRRPALDAVVGRSRQRAARRRTQLSAVAAVLAVGAAIPVLRTTLPIDDDPGIPPATTQSQTPATGSLFDVDFADATHGYALRSNCPGLDGPNCTGELLVTEDGEHWQARSLPVELRYSDHALFVRLYVLGPRSAAITRSAERERLRFFTSDAGQTWRQVPEDSSATIAEIPDRGLLAADCVAPPPAECTHTLTAVEPDTGRELRLATQPPLVSPIPTAERPLAGGWWVSGTDPTTGRVTLAVSRDAGRSWSTRALPSTPTKGYATMSGRGTTLYAAASSGEDAPDLPNGLLTLFRSLDGGATWEHMFNAEGMKEPRSVSGCPIATADGRLLIPTLSGAVWSSTDGGRSFTTQPNLDFAGFVRWTRAGYLASTSINSLSNVYKLSTDGVRWKEITIG